MLRHIGGAYYYGAPVRFAKPLEELGKYPLGFFFGRSGCGTGALTEPVDLIYKHYGRGHFFRKGDCIFHVLA